MRTDFARGFLYAADGATLAARYPIPRPAGGRRPPQRPRPWVFFLPVRAGRYAGAVATDFTTF